MKKMMGVVVCGVLSTVAYGDVAKPSQAAGVQHTGIVTAYANAQDLNTTLVAGEKVRELEALNTMKTAGLQQKQELFQKTQKDYNAKKSTLSKSACEAEESKLLALKNEISALVETSKLEVSRAVQEKTEEMVAAVEQAAAEVAKRLNVDVIVDAASGRALYVSEKAMVTDDLVKEMNKQFELAAAQQKNPKNTVVAANKKPAVKA